MAAFDPDERMRDITAESAEATGRILETVLETRETAGKVSTKLEEQGEQLRRIHRGTEEVKEESRQARREISKLQFFSCGLCTCRRQNKRKREGDASTKDHLKKHVETKENKTPPLSKGPFIKRITDDENEDKIEEDLRKTAEVVGEIRAEAIHIGEELDEHNRVVGEIIKTADEANEQLEDNTRKLRAELLK